MRNLRPAFLIWIFGLGTAFTDATCAQNAACETALDIDMSENCADIAVSHPIEGLQNFRELTTPDGAIRPGLLYRSDQLDALTETDIAKLSELGIETVVDLRAHDELESHPNKHIPSVDFTLNTPNRSRSGRHQKDHAA